MLTFGRVDTCQGRHNLARLMPSCGTPASALGRIEQMALTSELSIRFLRPAIGKVVWARADVDIMTRRSIVGTVRVWMDDDPDRITATAQGTYAIPIAK